MKIKFLIGLLLTIVWLVFAGFIFFSKSSIAEISVNELGDFLSGFISPVAIIWLVYGYIQQGYELASQKQEYINSIRLSAYVAMIDYETKERMMFYDKKKQDPNNNWDLAARNSKARAEFYKANIEGLLKDIEDKKL